MKSKMMSLMGAALMFNDMGEQAVKTAQAFKEFDSVYRPKRKIRSGRESGLTPATLKRKKAIRRIVKRSRSNNHK